LELFTEKVAMMAGQKDGGAFGDFLKMLGASGAVVVAAGPVDVAPARGEGSQRTCPICHGDAMQAGVDASGRCKQDDCPGCDGAGVVSCSASTDGGTLSMVRCPACCPDTVGDCLECGGGGEVYTWQAHTFGKRTAGGGELGHVRAALAGENGSASTVLLMLVAWWVCVLLGALLIVTAGDVLAVMR
jgi:hypothetical protein